MLRGSLNRTTRDVGARKNRNTLCSSRCYTRKRKTLQLLPFLLLLFSFLTRLPSLFLSLFLSLFFSFGFPPYTSTTRTPRYARALTVRRQMHPTMYFCCCAVYTRDAHAAGQGRLLSLRRGKAFLFFETKKILGNNENLYNFKDFIRKNFVIKNFSVIYYSLMTVINTYVHVACFFLYLLC